MRIILLLFTCAGLFGADLTGRWLGTWQTVNHPRGTMIEDHYLVIQQNNGSITGKTGPERGQLAGWELRNAKLHGDRLTFDGTTGALNLHYDLKLQGDLLVGSVVATNREGVQWKMRVLRQK